MSGFSSFDFHSREKNFSAGGGFSLHSGSKNVFFLFQQNQLFQFSQITFVARAQSQEGDERIYPQPSRWSKEQQNGSEKEKRENFSFFSEKNRQNFSKASSRQKSSIPSQKVKSGPNNSAFGGTNRLLETQKQQVVSITYEEIGLFPRSFNRVFDRFFKQLFFDVENFVIQEYRFYRYLFLTTVKCLFILLFVPLSINFLAKNYFIRPITEYFWNTQNHEIFLNSYQQKKAFSEFKNYEEKIYFESFLFSDPSNSFFSKKESLEEVSPSQMIEVGGKPRQVQISGLAVLQSKEAPLTPLAFAVPFSIKKAEVEQQSAEQTVSVPQMQYAFSKRATPRQVQSRPQDFEEKINLKRAEESLSFSTNFQNSLQKRLQTKIVELAKHYNEESIEAVTNFFADILSFATLWFLLVRLEIQINITKSFLLEVFFGLDDSKKSLLILFLTDLLVGYHSPNIWELFFQTLFDHYGLPESQTTIFLLVATLPVLLDVLFKYLIFRHLNRASPATVATYHAMIE